VRHGQGSAGKPVAGLGDYAGVGVTTHVEVEGCEMTGNRGSMKG
jgi:hypothetical protein